MMDLISFAFLPVNIIFTLLVILILLYWLSVIVGLMDVDIFDFDLPDDGLSIDADGDIDGGDVEAEGFMQPILKFFYIGEVPIMLILSIMFLSMWVVSMLGNYYLNRDGHFLIALPIYGGCLAAAVVVCRVLGRPLKKIYELFNKDSNAPRDVLGRICIVTTTSVGKNIGQAEIKTMGASILLYVVSDSEHIFHKDDEAVIVGEDKEKGIYRIAPVELKA